jgi:hypothetical protein
MEGGIDHEFTVAYNPQQDGSAEWMNSSLVTMARCMLVDSGVTSEFWQESISCTAYLVNQIVSTALNTRSAYLIVNGRDPEISHLKPFGCKAFPHEDNLQALKKWQPSDKVEVMLDYRSYRLWDLERYEIVDRRNVLFDEMHFPFIDRGLLPLTPSTPISCLEMMNRVSIQWEKRKTMSSVMHFLMRLMTMMRVLELTVAVVLLTSVPLHLRDLLASLQSLLLSILSR